MINLIFILMSFLVSANPTQNWSSALNIVDRHEFYANNEVILKPKNSWQTLFAIVYPDAKMNLQKDCVFYRVPGNDPGVLKIKRMPLNKSCESAQFMSGDFEREGVRSLQFDLKENSLSMLITLDKYKTEDWQVRFLNKFKRPEAKPLLSSAEYKTSKVIYLAPTVGQLSVTIKSGLCHDIGDNCQEKSPSTCSMCPDGWYEIPNGCSQGPKYCGELDCGKKNGPACRRGMKYQRVQKNYDCRTDSSFAYCEKGLEVYCQGSQAYCH